MRSLTPFLRYSPLDTVIPQAVFRRPNETPSGNISFLDQAVILLNRVRRDSGSTALGQLACSFQFQRRCRSELYDDETP